jgi:signal transduction histidine kinase
VNRSPFAGRSLDIIGWCIQIASLAFAAWLFSGWGPDFPEAPSELSEVNTASYLMPKDVAGRKEVSLPFSLPAANTRQGIETLQFSIPKVAETEQLGMCITRYSGSGEIKFKEQLLGGPSMSPNGVVNNSWGAHFVSLPIGATGVVNIELIAGPGKPIGLWPIWLGPVQIVRLECQNLDIKRRLVSGGIGLVLLSFGLLLLVQSYRQSDQVSFWCATTAIFATAKSLHFGIIDPPVSDYLWTLLYYCTRLVYAPAVFVFLAYLIDFSYRNRVAYFVFSLHSVFVAVFVFSEPSDWAGILKVQGGLYILIGAWIAVKLYQFRQSSSNDYDLVMTRVAIVGIALHGVEYISWLKQPELHLTVVSTAQFPMLLVFVSIILIEKRAEILKAVQEKAGLLTEKVQAQAAEIIAANEEIERVRGEALVAAERRRIMRDMHDGVGSHLIGAVSLLSQGKENKKAIDMIEQALLDIRNTVDSISADSASLDSLLGSLRHRIEPVLASSNIRLNWDVEGFAEGLMIANADTRLSLLRLIQEAFVNIIRHSHANEASFKASTSGDFLQFQIHDNGKGFDPTQARRGNGLKNIDYRAKSINATLDIYSSPAGTRIIFVMPLLGH